MDEQNRLPVPADQPAETPLVDTALTAVADRAIEAAGTRLGNLRRGKVPGELKRKTVAMKEAILAVYGGLQAWERAKKKAKSKEPDVPDHAHFFSWARKNPTEYYRLAARLIPVEIKGDIANRVGIVVFKRING